MLVQFFHIFSGKIENMFDEETNTFKFIVDAFSLKKYFIECRAGNNEINDWYIVPIIDFPFYNNIINYYSASGTSNLNRIRKNKMHPDDIVVKNLLLPWFHESIQLEFEIEEDALYFKLKFCS